MIQTNAAYQSILQTGKFTVKYKFTVNGTTDYFETDVVDGTIDEWLFEKLSIGNLMTKTLDIVFLPDTNVPRKSTIEVFFQIVGEDQTPSSWYPKGTYYVSTRTMLLDESMRVRAYDASLKSKVVFMPSGTWQETTAYALYLELCTKLGVHSNLETAEYLEDNDQPITTAPDIGQNGTTIKEMLCYIGTLYGKNWTVNEYNELAMIFPYSNAEEYDLADILVSPSVTIDRLRIWQNEGSYVQYPNVSEADWESMTGFIIEGSSPYVNADNIADIATDLLGTSYMGFDAADVVEDPALQLGDGLILDDNEVMLAHRLIVFGDNFTQCSAPYEEETENEYPELDPVARTVAKSEARTYAYIDVKSEEIIQEVSSTIEDNIGVNLSPFFSQPLSDIYNATSNPSGYWWSSLSTNQITQLTDGWAQVEVDNSSGTGTIWPLFYVRYDPDLFDYTDDEYTVLVEIKDAVITGGIAKVWFSNTISSNIPAYYVVSTAWSPTMDFDTDAVIRGRLIKTNNANPNLWFRCGFEMGAGVNASFKARISMFKVGYEGGYVPFVPSQSLIYENKANITINSNAIQGEVTERILQDKSLTQDINDNANALQKAINDTNTTVQSLSSSLTQTASEINATITQTTVNLQEYANSAADSAADDLAATLATYIRYYQSGGTGVLELGDNASGYIAKLNNQKLSFYDGETEVAYISNNKLYIANGQVTGDLQIGKYQWLTDSTGRMSLKWVG